MHSGIPQAVSRAVLVLVALSLAGCPQNPNPVQVSATSPANNSSSVALDSVITITFDRAVVANTLDIGLEPEFTFATTWSGDGRTVTLTPAGLLIPNRLYTITVWGIDAADEGWLDDPYVLRFTTATGNGASSALSGVAFWAYQIQGLSEPGAITALANSRYDMLVLEPTETDWGPEKDDRAFDTAGMVSSLKNSLASDGASDKIVIAYINIGQAEDWRWYWTWTQENPDDLPCGFGENCSEPLPSDFPDWIVGRDPDGWVGNYPVAFWDPAWKDLVLYGLNTPSHPDRDYVSILDEVLRAGFDGVYLDWVEAFEDPRVIAAAADAGIEDPVQEMIDFIAELRAYARQRDPDFLVIQQNASNLLYGGESGAYQSELLDAIDAIAQEEVWFDGDATDDWDDPSGYDSVVDADLTNELMENLGGFLDAGLPVFNCEYAVQRAPDAYTRSAQAEFICYATRRPLSRITTTPPPGLPSVVR